MLPGNPWPAPDAFSNSIGLLKRTLKQFQHLKNFEGEISPSSGKAPTPLRRHNIPMTVPILTSRYFSLPFMLLADASKVGIGAILSQNLEEGIK